MEVGYVWEGREGRGMRVGVEGLEPCGIGEVRLRLGSRKDLTEF